MATNANIMVRYILFAGRNIFPRHVSSMCYNKQYKQFMQSRMYCSAEVRQDVDPGPFFINKDVQRLLKILTRPDYKKVFRRRRDGRKLEEPKYKFMTDEELKEAQKRIDYKLQQLLQMPPVVKIKSEINDILSNDPEIQGYDASKYVFTDITFGIKDANRLIVIREPNGILRSAYCDERKRINQVYFPFPGREIVPPKMFYGEYLQNLLERNEYEFVLDRACIQYDPDEAEWHRVTQSVYEHVNKEKLFDKLSSTRHYGPMVFYLAWNKMIDNLLLNYLKTDKIEDAFLLIKLYNILHPNSKFAQMNENTDELDIILNYIQNESPNKGKLILAFNTFKELQLKKKNCLKTNEAHGIE